MASSDVPVPLLQGWVIFVSVTTFVLSSVYLALLVTGTAERIITDWNFVVSCAQASWSVSCRPIYPKYQSTVCTLEMSNTVMFNVGFL